MNLRKILNKVSIKIALITTLLVVVLFVSLNFLIVDRGARTFNDVYQIIRNQGPLPFDEDTPFIIPPTGSNLPFYHPSIGLKLTPREHFKSSFQASLLILGLIALLGAAGIGLLTSRIIAKPLKKMSTGLKKLRQSHYQLRLSENDSEEFNTIIKEFNNLAVELQRVEELRKNLISDTSHELKTPLASLAAQLEGIEDGVLTLDKNRLNILKEQVNRLTEMAEGLQDYAHLRSQAIKLQPQKFPLKEILNKIIEQDKKILEEKKMAVRLNFSSDYLLSADRKLLERVFNNLFDNVIRYSQAKNITITANQEQIIFTDDGIGIPSPHLQDIFERFFRLEKSRNRKTGGLGLGLAIVKEIIEAHGWKIYARIPQNNKGVEFVIDLKK